MPPKFKSNSRTRSPYNYPINIFFNKTNATIVFKIYFYPNFASLLVQIHAKI